MQCNERKQISKLKMRGITQDTQKFLSFIVVPQEGLGGRNVKQRFFGFFTVGQFHENVTPVTKFKSL